MAEDLTIGILLLVLLLISCRMSGLSTKYVRLVLGKLYQRLQGFLKVHFQKKKDRP